MRTRWISLIFLFSLGLSSCGASQAAVGQPAGAAPSDPQAMPSQEVAFDSSEIPLQSDDTPVPMDMTPSPADLNDSTDLAKKDLAERLGVDLDQINLLKTSEITWPDISTGCRPGTGQILTKGDQVYGYRIWLEAKGAGYIYHIGRDGQVIFCPAVLPGANNPLLMTPDGSTPDPQKQAP